MLNETDIKAMMCATYDNTSQSFETELHRLQSDLRHLNVEQRHKRLSDLDNILLKNILETCEECLGSRPFVPTLRATPTDQSNPISCFKKSFKSSTLHLESRHKDTSITEDIIQHYTKIFQNQRKTLPFDENRYRSKWLTLDQEERFGIGDLTEIYELFNLERVELAINSSSTSKSCGGDNVLTSALKQLCSSKFLSHLSNLFQLCCCLGLTPSRWNSVKVVPLKKSSETKFIDDTRPISLTTVIRRLFEKLLLKRLINDPVLKLNPCQAGFRAGFNTIQHAMISNDLGAKHPGILRCFIDFKAAYDSVPVHLLFDKLISRRLHPTLLSLTMCLFTDCSLTVGYKDLDIQSICLRNGLLQGSILSPLLFNLFIDSLADVIYSEDGLPGALLYADDVEIMSKDIVSLQGKLDTVHEWSLQNGMTINIKKCGAFVPNLRIGKELVPKVSSYKYLGIDHRSRFLDLRSHALKSAASASSILTHCQQAGAGWPEYTKLMIFKIFIAPKLEYGAPLLFATASIPNLQKVVDDSMMWIFKSRHPSITAAFAGICPFAERLKLLAAGFTDQLSNAQNEILKSIWHEGPSPTQQLWPRLRKSEELENWKRQATILKISWLTLRKKFQIGKAQEKTILSKLVSSECWSKSGVEYSFKIEDPRIRNAALRWRTGSMFTLQKCPGSELGRIHYFNRGCINYSDCKLVNILPAAARSTPLERLQGAYQKYSTLDQLLNDGKIALFMESYQILQQLLQDYRRR
jgi:predicted transcriptional regulator